MKRADMMWMSRASFYAGVSFCIVSGMAAFSDQIHLMGQKPISIFIVGIGLMVFNLCLTAESRSAKRS